jgi:ATP-dependent helicase/nuclease subunit A
LESLPDLPPGIRRAAAADYLSRAAPELKPHARDQIAAETLAVLEDPQFAPIFGPGSRAEVPLIGEISDRIISAQVDRLLVTEDSVTVIDYKTNRPPPKSADQVPLPYLSQMAAYRAVLARIYPKKSINCILLWTDGPRAMALPGALLDGHAP